MRNIIGLASQTRVDTVKRYGLDDFATFNEFEDDYVQTLAQAVRKGDQMQMNAIIEKRMKLACYGARLYTMINRDVDKDSLNLRRLKEIENHKKVVREHNDPTDIITRVSKTFSIDKALDILPNSLRCKFGVRGVALSYVIREDETPPPLEPLMDDKPYSEKSGSLMNELITHASHTGAGWDEDNATVFALLQEMVRDVPMASSLKRHQRARNGRGAYLSLVQHNLGSAQWDKILLKADEILNVRVWNGRNGRYSIRRHIDMHRDAYNDMVRASENIDYEVTNERTRVTRLLRSIQAGHIASVAAAKTTIEATPAKRCDFEEAADFLILNAPANRAMNQEHRIAAFYVDDNLDNVKVDERFYTAQEYRELSNRQKQKLKQLRDQRGDDAKGKRKKSNQNKGSNHTKRFKQMVKENKSLKQRISALEAKYTEVSEDDDEDSSNKVVTFNQRTTKTKKRIGKK